MPQPPVDRFPTKVWSSLVARHSRKFDAGQLHYQRPDGTAVVCAKRWPNTCGPRAPSAATPRRSWS